VKSGACLIGSPVGFVNGKGRVCRHLVICLRFVQQHVELRFL